VPFETQVDETTPVLDAGIYPAVFVDIEEASNDNGTYWLWRFMARDGDNDTEITATSSPRITPRTKAAKFLAGFGVNVEVGTKVNFADYIDMPVMLVVSVNADGYSRIENVLPYKQDTAAKAGKAK
jgi:hypothetical protein